jgi:molecular chaperone HtpG
MPRKVKFKTEVKQILDLVVNSLYSNKEIFLRELISNASDAIDKVRYLALTDDKILEGDSTFKIKIIPNKEEGTLTISDNGLGMTKEEAVEALGTIAHSGTKNFLEAIQTEEVKNNPELIGQFGVGFYSAFMVANKVRVVTRKAGVDENEAVVWESEADGTFTTEKTVKENRGTDVILYLKDDEKEYLDEWRIKEIVKKYSDYIEYPIVMDVEKTIPDENDKEKTITVVEEETLNSMTAVWLKDKSEITDEEYNEFYKHISHDFNDPAEKIHFKAEGTTEFTALLYIPSKAPFDILYKEFKAGPALYVKKVQIMDHCEELIPLYLRFVKGVVDSSDLPLNVSREMLQNNKQIAIINKNITKKVLSKLKEMKEKDFEKYKTFHKEFGRVLKEGIHYDMVRKEEIASLLIFQSTKTTADEYTDFDKYIKNMPEDQKEIYYITGSNLKEVEASPYLESLKEKGYEVLYMLDEIDDIIMSSLMEYKGKKLRSIIKGDIDLDDKDKKEKEEKEKELKDLLKAIKDSLGDKVTDVKISGRLVDSACCLVSAEGDIDPQMAKLFEAMGQPVPTPKRILEVNYNHELFKKLKSLYEVDKNSSLIKDYSSLLYDLSLVMEGNKVDDPAKFSKLVTELMAKGI